MKKLLFVVLALLLLAGCGRQQPADDPESCRFMDDTGVEIAVSGKPAKVAVLTSSLADLWITAGGQVDITVYETLERGFVGAGVTLVDDGAGKTVNLEMLVAEKPDFVLYSSDLAGQRECAQVLRDAGIPAAGFAVDTFDDYLRLLKICTDILDTPDAYIEYGIELQKEVNALIAQGKSQAIQPKILFVRAGSGARYTKAKTADNHFVCVMLRELGTFNIAEKAPVLLDGLSTEEILISDPDMIFFTTMGDESAGKTYMESLVQDPVWQNMTAVQMGNVHQLPKELFQYKPNSRWDEAYAYLIKLLYGDIL